MRKNTSTFLTRINVVIEVIFVLLLGFGLFIFSSTRTAFFSNSAVIKTQSYNSLDFIFIVSYELIVLFIIAHYLKYRRWTLKDFNLDFTPIMLGIGLILAFIRIGSGIGLSSLIASLNLVEQNTINTSGIAFQSNIFSIVLIVIVNSFFEEILLIGYLFKRFENLHPAFIILISSIIRVSFHTYLGWQHLPSVFALALIFGVYYISRRKLWPVIIAHGIGNSFYFLNEYYQWIDV